MNPLRVANFQKKNPGEADVNNDGTLSPDELRVGLGRFGVKDDAVEVVMTALDLDGDGKIDYTEFCAGCMAAATKLTDDKLPAPETLLF